MIGHFVDVAKVLALAGLVAFCILRSRWRSSPAVEATTDPPVTDGLSGVVRAVVVRDEDVSDGGGRDIPLAVDSTNVRSVVVGRNGRFYQCTERLVDGQFTTRVTEVDDRGADCGVTMEVPRSLSDMVTELI